MKNKEKKVCKDETRNETKIKKKGKNDKSKKDKNGKKKEILGIVEKIDVNKKNASDRPLKNNKKQDDTHGNTSDTKESSLLNESKNIEQVTLNSGLTSTSSSTSSFFDFIKNSIEQRIPNVGRDLSTRLSIAIPSTIINHKNDVVKAYITSYLARICTIFSIERIYIYDDQIRYEKETPIERNRWDGNWKNETKEENCNNRTNKNGHEEKSSRGGNGKNKNIANTINDINTMNNKDNKDNKDTIDTEYSYLCKFLHYNLQYLETPQYLRKHLFPITPFLKNTGIMNPVDAPHHLRSDEWLPFREGVIVEKKEKGLVVDVGLFSNAFIKTENSEEEEEEEEEGEENSLRVGTRVTVLFDETSYHNFEKRNKTEKNVFTGKLISPQIPLLYNVYWGYSIEVLKNVSDIFQLKFDYLVGTSERGTHTNGSCVFKKGRSILIVFGNKDGLEDLLIREKEEKKKKHFSAEERQKQLNKILKKFDFFLNTCPFQTSRTIRTEEAVTITLSIIHNVLK